jgi:hypothetical protein
MRIVCFHDVTCVVAGITGTVSIDANGDRNADYSLLDLDTTSDKFQVSARSFTLYISGLLTEHYPIHKLTCFMCE